MRYRFAAAAMSAVVAGSMLCSCNAFDFMESDSSENDTQVTTATLSDRARTATTTKSYKVEDEKVYTTSTRVGGEAVEDDIDPDSFERVSVATTTKKKRSEIELTTTTTTMRSAYNTLQKPKNDEYFEITKQYRTSKDTQLRYGPSKDYTAQNNLSAGTSLACYGKSGKWYYCLYNSNIYGWVEESALEGIDKKTTKKEN